MPADNDTSHLFKQAVYTELAAIPPGKVASYGRVAENAGFQGYSRHVGRCLKNLPNDSKLPWHRVLRASGEIAFPKGSSKYNQQRQRLEEEGIVFRSGKVPKDFFY